MLYQLSYFGKNAAKEIGTATVIVTTDKILQISYGTNVPTLAASAACPNRYLISRAFSPWQLHHTITIRGKIYLEPTSRSNRRPRHSFTPCLTGTVHFSHFETKCSKSSPEAPPGASHLTARTRLYLLFFGDPCQSFGRCILTTPPRSYPFATCDGL